MSWRGKEAGFSQKKLTGQSDRREVGNYFESTPIYADDPSEEQWLSPRASPSICRTALSRSSARCSTCTASKYISFADVIVTSPRHRTTLKLESEYSELYGSYGECRAEIFDRTRNIGT